MIQSKLPDYDLRSFASPIYDIVGLIVDESAEYLHKNKDAVVFRGLTTRQWLQKVGAGLRNEIYPDIWIEVLMREYHSVLHGWDSNSHWIIDDLRYQNEAEALLDYPSFLIRLNGRGEDDSHETEHGFDEWNGWDWTHDNSGEMRELEELANQITGTIRERK